MLATQQAKPKRKKIMQIVNQTLENFTIDYPLERIAPLD